MKAFTLSMQSETLPQGYNYFLVLNDDGFNGDMSGNWDNPWYLAIIDKTGNIVEQSTTGNPATSSQLFGKEFDAGSLYGILGTINELVRWKNHSLEFESSRQFDKDVVSDLKSQGKPNTINYDPPKPVTGPIDDFVKAYSNSEEVFVKQADRKVAQSQAAINANRIRELEEIDSARRDLVKKISLAKQTLAEFEGFKKELDQARELQKLLKKLR